MRRRVKVLGFLVSAGVLVVVVLTWLLASRQSNQVLAQDAPPPLEHKPPTNYSPCADRRFPTRVYWGDPQLHT